MRHARLDALVVGLGNPGESYSGNRHNIGWMVLDDLKSTDDWGTWESFDNGASCEGHIGSLTVSLVKPMTMMNSSGEAVVHFLQTHVVEMTHLIVVHDEMDIDFCEVKMKVGGGHAGHRGVKSVIECLGTKDFHRIRCGIGRPRGKTEVLDHVLGDFDSDERESVPNLILQGSQKVRDVIQSFKK